MQLSTTTDVLHREEQRFRQPWLLTLLAAETAICLAVLVALWQPQGGSGLSRSPPLLVLVSLLVLIAGPGVFWLLLSARLITEVRRDGLYLRFVPFHRRFHRIDLAQATRIEAVEYRPVRDYGGWGIRLGRRGKAYNVSGCRGVRLDFADGRHVLIGSQDAESLATAIHGIC